ncbi:hypothetical protein [Marinobacter shengliensis]|uniref:hypothetical protein n=1 Tax=Marinobacter shengliensis TaxID=1389223 RepID=UPI002572AA2F|nr:hypothetical protein [Marinobacter shengliensis]BEH15151.1 hypothetical protein MAALD49_25190 [Marinobacter shengliensis]
MTEQKQRSGVSDTAFRAMEIGPLPISPKERTRVGDELQPYGAYANLNPYHRTVEDIDTVQYSEREDPEFYKENWWWDHQRLRFLNEKMGLKFLILVLPFTWIFTLLIGGSFGIGYVFVNELREDYPTTGYFCCFIASFVGWMVVFRAPNHPPYHQLAYDKRCWSSPETFRENSGKKVGRDSGRRLQ